MDATETRNTLFLHHFHTEKSTDYVNELTEEPEWKGINHLGDPVKILEKLGEGQKAVIVLTEHYRTNREGFFRELGEEAEELGGSYELNERSLVMEHEDSKVAIINGVEASYRRRDSHLVLVGLPLREEKEYYNIEGEELSEVLEDAAFAHPAHPFLGEFGMDMEELEEVCETIKESSAELFIPYTYAYPVNIDRNARGETDSEINVQRLAEKYDAQMIVEHDHHVHLPSGLGGIGLLEDSAIEKLESGEIPLGEIKDMKVIEPTKLDTFQDLFRAGRTYADQLPNYMEWKGLWKRLTFPYGREELKELRDRYYSAELEDLDMDELRKRSRKLN
ncbi:MAG: hypothetical protein ABEK16_01210 [Candidatus Nanohalobium sp.]